MTHQDTDPESTSNVAELRRLTAELLSYDESRGMLVGLVMEIVEILERSAEFQIDPDTEVTDGETRSGDGLALSPAHAARVYPPLVARGLRVSLLQFTVLYIDVPTRDKIP